MLDSFHVFSSSADLYKHLFCIYPLEQAPCTLVYLQSSLVIQLSCCFSCFPHTEIVGIYFRLFSDYSFFSLFTVTLGKNSWWPFEQYLVSHECRICQVLLAFPGFLILCTYGRSTSKWFKKTISKCSCMTCVLYVTYYIILKLWASASLLRRSAVPFFW